MCMIRNRKFGLVKSINLLLLVLLPVFGLCQSNIAAAFRVLGSDSQLKHALTGFSLIRISDGKQVFGAMEDRLLLPASTQKVLTAGVALSLLKPEYRFCTNVVVSGPINDGILNGDLYIIGSGDPTLGSPRFPGTGAESFIARIVKALRESKIQTIRGDLVVNSGVFSGEDIPDGWIWQDLANYYGAAAAGFNWRENKFDIFLKSGNKPGDSVSVIRTEPELYFNQINNLLTAGPRGSGDKAYCYFQPGQEGITIRGTIPAGEASFRISASYPSPAAQFLSELSAALMANAIEVSGRNRVDKEILITGPGQLIMQQCSPSLDSLVKPFLKNSINLYGEALLKTLGTLNGKGSTTDGVKMLTRELGRLGIPDGMVLVQDGSGLSPQNGVTPEALARFMAVAKKQIWFQPFYEGLPLVHQYRMKSGTINGVRCYTGYIKSKKNVEYAFALMTNRYTGSSSSLSQKLWKFLDACRDSE